jgi:hypothetical protein
MLVFRGNSRLLLEGWLVQVVTSNGGSPMSQLAHGGVARRRRVG